jgi:phage/plasmid-like protein (TIGR03299 family)
MAHNINTTEGRKSFAYVGERPWHGLGLKVPAHMTRSEAMVAGGLDWIVDAKDVYIPAEPVVGADGSLTEKPAEKVKLGKVTVRRDTGAQFGFVGNDYVVVQNMEAFEPFDLAFGKGAAVIETVGALGNGSRVFMMAKCPEVAEIVPNDVVERFLLITTAHDGSGAVKVLFTPIRVVCQNTLTAAIGSCKNMVSIKHTKNAHEMLKKAHEMLVSSDTYWTKCQESLKYLAQKQMSTTEVSDFLKKLFPGKKLLDGEEEATRTKNQRERIETLFNGQATGSDLAGKTRWGMLNAVTHFIDHERNGRSRKDGRTMETTGMRWENSVEGLGSGLRQKAMDLLLV